MRTRSGIVSFTAMSDTAGTPGGESKPFAIATECALILFAANAGLVFFWFNRKMDHDWVQLALMLSIPAAAAVALALLGLAAPDLYRPGKLSGTLVLLLPIVCTMFILLLVALATTGYTGIQRAPDQVRPVFQWIEPRNLGLAAVAQFVALGLVAMLRSK